MKTKVNSYQPVARSDIATSLKPDTPPPASHVRLHRYRQAWTALRDRPMKGLILFTALIVAGALLAAAEMAQSSTSWIAELGSETAKFTVQLLLIAITGGVIVKEFDRLRVRTATAHEFRRQLLRSLIRAYSDTKKLRRMLRAKCVMMKDADTRPVEGMPGPVYDEYMSQINTTQIELEVLVREIKVFQDTLTHAGPLTRQITGMEKYLGKLIDEYEDKRKSYETDCKSLPALPRLRRFLAKDHTGDFRSGFATYFHSALTSLRMERLSVG